MRLQKTLSERHVQVLVLDPQAPIAPPPAGWTQVMEIDPTSSHWYDLRRAIPKLPSFIPVREQHLARPACERQHDDRAKSAGPRDGICGHELGASPVSTPATDPAWVAYPLSGAKPGLPHLLEIEYPSDLGQTLGISIVEPNAAGAVAPIGLDSGVYTADDPLPGNPHWAKHRMMFWPRTSSPLLLLTNRRDGSRAQFGKIRLSAGPSPLAAGISRHRSAARTIAGRLSRPAVVRGQLFRQRIARSVDRPKPHRLANVLRRGHAAGRLSELRRLQRPDAQRLFRRKHDLSQPLLEPTPRFDTGAFFDQGQDPARKDVLELLLRLFDREHLKLIPTLQFSTPLPELEALLRTGGPASDGIQLIGPDGLAWTDGQPSHHGLAPYYNPLDERVQRAVLAVVRELVDRYGKHPSLAGLGLELSADGYMQLPGELWGLDDQTIHRFERDMHVDTGAGNGPDRFAKRAAVRFRPRASAMARRGAAPCSPISIVASPKN